MYFWSFFNYLKIRKSRLFKKNASRTQAQNDKPLFFKKNASRTQTKNDKPLFFSEHKTGHNSGSWPPLEMKSSAFDSVFHDGSNGASFKFWNIQNNDEQSRARQKQIGADKKIGPEKNENLNTMFWPFRTMGNSGFGMGSHRRSSFRH